MPVDGGFTPEFSWLNWGGDISVVAGVFLLEALYLLSVGPLRTRFPGSSDVSTRRIVFFSLGLWTIFFALYSPLDQLSDHYLFSAHMVQHLLLVLVGPPLMLLGTPGWMLRPFLGIPGVFGVAKVLTFPVLAALLFNILFAVWHAPAIYEAGLNRLSVHIVQHLTFIATGVIMWWPVLSPMKELPRLPYAGQVLYLFRAFNPSGYSRRPYNLFRQYPLRDLRRGTRNMGHFDTGRSADWRCDYEAAGLPDFPPGGRHYLLHLGRKGG